ncbi:MAG: carbohydrate ABC transporter permease [Nitrososphaerales archaeon]|jgi:multiple sugar transport system permease protein|nr:carbohydrate ABC transporter permease [Nitrososphaerales archaeon]|tara:strand:+ start:2264 stop:3151 length:888 start_codon:yes stop_codon:yes gene_type:complete
MSNSIFKAKNLRFVIIGFWLIIVLFPLSWIALTSVKPTEATLSTTPVFLFTPTLQNYMFGAEIMDPHTNEPIFAGIASQFPRYLGNSILIALMSTFIALAAGLTFAYSLSRFKIIGGTPLLAYMLTLHAVTPIVFTPALFEIFQKIGLHDTHIGLSLIYATFALPLTVWILKNFLDGFPKTSEEAAKVDGASTFDVLLRITLPQIKVGLAVAAVFAFAVAWNDFIFTLSLTETNAATFVFLADFFDDLLRVGVLTPGPLASMSIIHMIPSFIFAFLIQRYLLIGFSAGTIRKEMK